jgi:prophage antirepressor-like protein
MEVLAMQEKIYSSKELAGMFQVQSVTVRKWAQKNEVAYIGEGKRKNYLFMVEDDERCLMPKKSLGIKEKGQQDISLVSETGLYVLIIRSNLPEAKAFRKWVCGIIKFLREAVGYEQWKVKTFTDSVQNHHLNMDIIKQALEPADKVPYVKAHSIANKCIANIVGEAKAIGKDGLKARFPEMIPLRDEILTDTAKLMELNDRFNLGVSVSQAIYRKYGAQTQQEGAAG